MEELKKLIWQEKKKKLQRHKCYRDTQLRCNNFKRYCMPDCWKTAKEQVEADHEPVWSVTSNKLQDEFQGCYRNVLR